MSTKTYIVLLTAAVVINLLLVVAVTKYNIIQWTIPAYYNPGKETKDTPAKPQTQAPAKYDFSKHVSYRLQVLQTENSTLATYNGCASVMADPVSFWRSRRSTSTNFTAEVDFARMKLASRCTTIPIADFIKTPPVSTLYSFETPYLEDPPVKDILKVSNESTSSVTLANSSSTFFIGDTVALFIIVRDGEGHPKSKGGDEIRAWFTDVSSSNSSLPAKITDYGNGTYLATAVLAFVGTFRAFVSLAYSREYIQTFVLNQLTMKATVIHVGAFSNSLANETSVCSHVPVIPGANNTEICDVTEINGSPWFCGRPVNPWLTCTDFVQTRRFERFITMPMNTVEKLLMNRNNTMSFLPGGSNITFTVSARADNKNITRLTSSKKCSSIPPRLTWEQPEPTGYLYQGLWHSYMCRRPERASDTCLRNIHIIMLGDSNGRELYQAVASRSSCKEQIIRTYTAWHRPLKCINKLLNFTVEWLPHSNPFRTTPFEWNAIRWLKASNKVIDTIPNTGRYLIHLNHYLHPSTSHVSAYANMMVAIKASLVRLMKRNPNVTIVLQGPHIAWRLGQQSSYLLGDTQRFFFTTIQYEVFDDLRDHIYYLQTSDITIASINNEYHPVHNWQISNQLLGFICER